MKHVIVCLIISFPLFAHDKISVSIDPVEFFLRNIEFNFEINTFSRSSIQVTGMYGVDKTHDVRFSTVALSWNYYFRERLRGFSVSPRFAISFYGNRDEGDTRGYNEQSFNSRRDDSYQRTYFKPSIGAAYSFNFAKRFFLRVGAGVGPRFPKVQRHFDNEKGPVHFYHVTDLGVVF